MLIVELLNVAARCVHRSSILVVDSTVLHFIPSNTENFAILDGEMLLFIARTNAFSLLIIVNSGEPIL